LLFARFSFSSSVVYIFILYDDRWALSFGLFYTSQSEINVLLTVFQIQFPTPSCGWRV